MRRNLRRTLSALFNMRKSAKRNCLNETELLERNEELELKIDMLTADCTNYEIAIDKLKAAQPHWVSVEERLPDDSRDVLIFHTSGIVGIGSLIGPNWYQWYSGGGLPVDVTHWMPLPEPPKEVQDGQKEGCCENWREVQNNEGQNNGCGWVD